MRKILLVLTTFTLSASALAEDHFYVGPHLNYQYWDENRFQAGLADDNGVQLGLNLGIKFDAGYALELAAQTSASDTNAEADVFEINYYGYGAESSIGNTPYIVAGLFSYVNMDPDVVIDKSTTNFSLGAGISRMLGDSLEWKSDIRFRTALDSNISDRILDIGLTTALNYHFGRSGTPAPAAAAPSAPAPVATPVVERAPAPAPVAAPAPATAPAPAPQVREVTVELDVLFETNSSIITDLDDAEFRRMADALEENPGVTLTIEGHTDSDGSSEYNETLSQRRADRVKTALVEQYNAPENRITAIGYGESRPVATNETNAGKAQNRRVVGVITYQVAQ